MKSSQEEIMEMLFVSKWPKASQFKTGLDIGFNRIFPIDH